MRGKLKFGATPAKCQGFHTGQVPSAHVSSPAIRAPSTKSTQNSLCWHRWHTRLEMEYEVQCKAANMKPSGPFRPRKPLVLACMRSSSDSASSRKDSDRPLNRRREPSILVFGRGHFGGGLTNHRGNPPKALPRRGVATQGSAILTTRQMETAKSR